MIDLIHGSFVPVPYPKGIWDLGLPKVPKLPKPIVGLAFSLLVNRITPSPFLVLC